MDGEGRVVALFLALAAFAMPGSLHAQSGFGGRPGMRQEGAGKLGGAGGFVRPSSLQPVFPARARCPGIASPFGSQTRYDGSYRDPSEFGGRHGGIDISLPIGTPLLAVAAGTVVSKGEGGLLEGIYLWLRHSPEDTGFPYWVYSKYQHLDSMPQLEIGTKVTVGQVIARSGNTGTAGRHYGPSGYAHLHLGTGRSPSGDQPVGTRGQARGLRLFDPVAIYTSGALREVQGETEVPIPYATGDGTIVPSDTRTVWPVACQPK